MINISSECYFEAVQKVSSRTGMACVHLSHVAPEVLTSEVGPE